MLFMRPRYKIDNMKDKYFLGISNDKECDLYYFLYGDTKFIYAKFSDKPGDDMCGYLYDNNKYIKEAKMLIFMNLPIILGIDIANTLYDWINLR